MSKPMPFSQASERRRAMYGFQPQRSRRAAALTALLLCAGAAPGWTQEFSTGSDGSYGPIFVGSASGTVTLDMPEDGIFQVTSMTVQGNGRLYFRRNALNTPVIILSQGDIRIEGEVNVNGGEGTNNPPQGGLAGPGGFDGGHPGTTGVPPGDGRGPGGGRGGSADCNAADGAGSASYGGAPNRPSPGDGAPYGSPLLVPLVGGSGGGGVAGSPGYGGGGGGGAIGLFSDTQVVIASGADVNANGGRATSAGCQNGSGGAVRIVAPRVAGAGRINVNGASYNESAGHGRVRIDTLDRTGLNLDINPDAAGSVGSFMVVFPEPLPRLDVVEAAGRSIDVGSGPVNVFLRFGSTPDRTVVVQATNFTGTVPITVALYPENGSATFYEAEIDMNTGNPATTTADVTFPINTATSVVVWTR